MQRLRFLPMILVMFGATVLVGACSTPEPPSLTPPSAALLQACGPLAEIPKGDGDIRVRAEYYASSRRQYGECADRHAGLARWARVAAAPTPPK